MSTIKVTFNIDSKLAEIQVNEKVKSGPICITDINNYTQIASISWNLDDEHKWDFCWEIWARHEQFVTFSEYNSKNEKPCKDYVKWSFIGKPQKGTCQNSKVHKMLNNCPSNISDIVINVYSQNYGDWTTINCEEGYFY